MSKLVTQIFRFGIVGVLSFLIDYILMIIFTEFFGIWYFASALISFIVSVIFNYCASMKYVFQSKDDISKTKEFILFVFLSVIGLAINQLGLWLMVDFFCIHYMFSKIIVTGVVMIWNFVSRKIFIEK